MRANLARHGRRLLNYQARAAPSCILYATPIRRRTISRPVMCRTFERTFFNALFQKPPREVRQPQYEPGWLQIMVWRSRILDNVRPPPRRELLEALRKLLKFKIEMQMPFNSTQALQCRRLLEYLEQPTNDENIQQVTPTDLAIARKVLLHTNPIERSQHHLELAKSLYNIWSSRGFPAAFGSERHQLRDLVRAMSMYGGAREALDILYSKWNDLVFSGYMAQEDRAVEIVAHGLAREGKEAELVSLVEHAEKNGVEYEAGLQAVIVKYFAEQDRVQETKYWMEKPITNTYSRASVYRIVAFFAMRNSLQEWATSLFLKLGELQPNKKHWDVILQAILITGRSLAEVEALVPHMISQDEPILADIHTINSLLRVAAEQRDPALADDILAYGAQRGLVPNGETYLISLHLRLNTDNLAAAEEAYNQVKHIQPWTNETKPGLFREFRHLTNQFLVALCADSRPNFKFISSVLEAVEEAQMRLEPETVATLCLRFLENDQHFEVMDILSTYSFLYSEAEREVIQNSFVLFCLDPSTSTNRAWAAYQLLQQFFQDASFDRRVQLMDSFFERKRPDMASQVFGHMRGHRNKSFHPTLEVYVKCLEGIAQYPDLEGLDMVHNMLKMDTSIQPSTQLFTALMLAYASCEQPLIAWDYWNQITQSREGPSYNTLEAVFWTLEKKPGGYRQARELWERIERMDLEIPPSVYNAYIGAMAGSGNENGARSLILQMASYVGSGPDAMTLGIAYNALPGQELQSQFQEWAKKHYRDEWAELMKFGRRMNEYSLCQFKLNRVLKA